MSRHPALGAFVLLTLLLACLAAGSAAVASALLPDPGPPDAWETYRFARGRFSVRLPDLPSVATDSRWTPVGRIHQARYSLTLDDARVVLEHHDLPRVAVLMFPQASILNRARNSLVSDVGGEVLASSDAPRDGRATREVTYTVPGDEGLVERALIQLVDTRLYVLVVTLPRARSGDPRITQLFGSFEVWPSP